MIYFALFIVLFLADSGAGAEYQRQVLESFKRGNISFAEIENRHFEVSFPVEVDGVNYYKIVVSGKLNNGELYHIDTFAFDTNTRSPLIFSNQEERFVGLSSFHGLHYVSVTSPDGRHRAVTNAGDRYVHRGEIASALSLRVIDLESGEVLRHGNIWCRHEHNLTWSEDGRFLAYSLIGHSHTKTIIIDTADSTEFNLFEMPEVFEAISGAVGSEIFTGPWSEFFITVEEWVSASVLQVRLYCRTVDFGGVYGTLQFDAVRGQVVNIEYEFAYDRHNIEVTAPLTIQDLFEPIDTYIYFEGLPHPERLYPFGEISGMDGRADYVIFVAERHHVEQWDNFLRISPDPDRQYYLPVPVFMTIEQWTNISVPAALYRLKSDYGFGSYPFSYAFYMPASEDFPFSSFALYEGMRHDSMVTRVFVRDNTQGGVFVIRTQHFFVAISGWGVRMRHYVGGLEMVGGG